MNDKDIIIDKAYKWLESLLNEIGDNIVKFTSENKKKLLKELLKELKS